jgi:hypothetical protein
MTIMPLLKISGLWNIRERLAEADAGGPWGQRVLRTPEGAVVKGWASSKSGVWLVANLTCLPI